MLKALLKDSVLYTLPSIVSSGISLFLVPVYTRILSPADYGAFDLILLMGTFVNLTVACQIWHGVARYYSEEEDPERRVGFASTSFWFTLPCYTTFLVVMLVFSGPMSHLLLKGKGLEGIFRIGMGYLWGHGIFFLIQNQLRWELRSFQFLIANLAMTFGTAACALYFAYVLGWGLQGVLYGSLAGVLLGATYGLWCLRGSYRLRFSGTQLREMLAFSVPLVPAGVAFFITQYSDRFMISRFLSLRQVGIYGIGFRMASVVGIAMVGFQWALTPLVYRNYKDPRTPERLAQIYRLFMGGALLACLALSVFSREILRIMTAPAYHSAVAVVPLLTPAVFLSQMAMFAPGPNLRKKTIVVLWINLVGATAGIVVCALLTMRFGMVGAAASTLLACLGIFAAHMSFSQRYYPVPHSWARIATAVAGTAVLVAVGYFVVPQGLAGLLFGALLCAIGALLVVSTGLVTSGELALAGALLRDRCGLGRRGEG
jgi:O-antigen/teichoic acid export membrane protein